MKISENELFFPNQPNFRSDTSQLLILQDTISVKFLPRKLERQFNNAYHALLWFPYLALPFQPHSTSIGYTKIYAKTSQSHLLSCYIIKPYVSETHNHQKAESLRTASISKLQYGQ